MAQIYGHTPVKRGTSLTILQSSLSASFTRNAALFVYSIPCKAKLEAASWLSLLGWLFYPARAAILSYKYKLLIILTFGYLSNQLIIHNGEEPASKNPKTHDQANRK